MMPRATPAGIAPQPSPPRLLVSRCLLGEAVRYDGGHTRHPFVADHLASRVEVVAMCPELEAGMGVPRPPIHLVATPQGISLQVVRTGRDVSDLMTSWIHRTVYELAKQPFCAAVLKSRSPSCGVRSTPLYGPTGRVLTTGPGLFAAAVCRVFPDLPLFEETSLAVAWVRDCLDRLTRARVAPTGPLLPRP